MRVHNNKAIPTKNDPSSEVESFKSHLEEVRHLTGCPLAYVIESRCEEQGCQNQGLHLSDQFTLDGETCKLLKELISEGEVVLSDYLKKQFEKGETNGKSKEIPKPIIQTKPRLRCVL